MLGSYLQMATGSAGEGCQLERDSELGKHTVYQQPLLCSQQWLLFRIEGPGLLECLIFPEKLETCIST